MPNNLHLAVAIADTTATTPIVGEEEAIAKAEHLAARHPESDASVEEVADALREASLGCS
ncbi:hypothetical protein [Terrihabitans sp. B22-R8]|uniref:hypothetical protein n=1 Tax=Terrihabitans sp. B22-R8 TaxID=3425128 RepID=UPI00403CC9A0